MSNFPIDADSIRKLAELMNETGLSEIEVAEGERSLRVAKHAAPVAASVLPAAAAPAAIAAAPAAAAPADHPGAVKSPMVGTAYLQGEPGAPPFIKVGDRVNAGQTLLIIEAMKVMNPIKADRAGTISAIMVRDAQPVEFGEVLLVLE